MKKSGGFTYLGLAAALAAWYNATVNKGQEPLIHPPG